MLPRTASRRFSWPSRLLRQVGALAAREAALTLRPLRQQLLAPYLEAARQHGQKAQGRGGQDVAEAGFEGTQDMERGGRGGCGRHGGLEGRVGHGSNSPVATSQAM